ncbi:hypothetical protein E2562_022788, partial [Oryza meyeriana var. granulata]
RPVDADVASNHGVLLIQHQPEDTEGASIPSAEQEQAAATMHDGFGEIPVTPSMFLQADEQMMEPEVHKKIDEICELEGEPPLDQMVHPRNTYPPQSVVFLEDDRCVATGTDIVGSFADGCMMEGGDEI